MERIGPMLCLEPLNAYGSKILSNSSALNSFSERTSSLTLLSCLIAFFAISAAFL